MTRNHLHKNRSSWKRILRGQAPRTVIPLVLILLGCIVISSHATALDREELGSRKDLEDVMAKLTESVSVETAVILPASLMLLGREEEFEAGQLCLISFLSSAAAVGILKYAVNRQRPTPPTIRKNSSLPSGHAAGTFALATIVSAQYPRLTVPVYLYAGAVSYSRIYLRRHYPTDVAVGALVGLLSARFALKYRRMLTLGGRGLAGLLMDDGRIGIYLLASW